MVAGEDVMSLINMRPLMLHSPQAQSDRSYSGRVG
jgi:hypothetical protein